MHPTAWLLVLQLGCGDGASESGTTDGLPPDGAGDGGASAGDGGADGGSDDGSGGTYTGGTEGGGPEVGDDEAPAHLLELRQEGTWDLSPYPGPFESLSGELVVTELLDGDEALPACTATFALTGYAADATCDGCQAAFEVLHFLAQDGGLTEDEQAIPGLDACLAPDLPAHDEVWTLGLSADGATIYRQTGLGGWVPWFDAALRLDTVEFAWTATVGVEGEEEEEE